MPAAFKTPHEVGEVPRCTGWGAGDISAPLQGRKCNGTKAAQPLPEGSRCLCSHLLLLGFPVQTDPDFPGGSHKRGFRPWITNVCTSRGTVSTQNSATWHRGRATLPGRGRGGHGTVLSALSFPSGICHKPMGLFAEPLESPRSPFPSQPDVPRDREEDAEELCGWRE